ncbi:MAG: coproporphyrinogen dehydrogenase HemZ [Firmicutes bacterium]|nr:coproporphyrinogen dehydrogenase HemZ [Bacillota bacterium]
MYDFLLKDVKKAHEYEELVKAFLRPDEFRLYSDDLENVRIPEGERPTDDEFDHIFSANEDKNALKREIYGELSRLTGKTLPWGIITGIRPVKLTGEIVRSFDGETDRAREVLINDYYVEKERADKALEIYGYQQKTAGSPEEGAAGVYIGIPFCPTRCLYCSFTSNQKDMDEIDRYLECLYREIDWTADRMEKAGMWAESIYIGGGTPTTLDEERLGTLLDLVNSRIRSGRTREITLEAGRADTITADKLAIAKTAGVDRISINPQTMKASTLELIGRETSIDQIEKAFGLATESGIPTVNADLIAGLPEETADDFRRTMQIITGYRPENITVHNLAIKRSSRLAGIDRDYHYKAAETVAEMLDAAEESMKENGYRAYYLYRQKQMAGAGENTGYCLPGHEGIYNIRIMEEAQSIIAMGAGGISKAYFPSENRHERIANVSNYEVYIEKIDEMLRRKEEGLFEPLMRYQEGRDAY